METHTHLRTQFEKETKLIFGLNINEYFLWLERKYLSRIKTADKCNVSGCVRSDKFGDIFYVKNKENEQGKNVCETCKYINYPDDCDACNNCLISNHQNEHYR